MDLLEITQEETPRREEVPARPHARADALARHNDVEFERGGMHFTVRVPRRGAAQGEFEMEDDGAELEIELSW